jgi:hypothetical protein
MKKDFKRMNTSMSRVSKASRGSAKSGLSKATSSKRI